MAISRSTGSSLDLNSRWLPNRLNARSSPSPPASMRKMFIGGSPILASVSCVSGSSVAGSGYGMRAMASHHRPPARTMGTPAAASRTVVSSPLTTSRNGSTQMALTIAAQKPIHETHQVAEDGAVDADGHILEPPTLWEEYIDPQFRDRALRFKLDENGPRGAGVSTASVSTMSRRGFPATLGAMGAPDLVDMQKNPDRTYLGEAPYGSMDPTSGSTCSTPSTSTPRSCTRPSACCGRPRSRIPRCRRPTPRPTTAGSASSAPTSRGSSRPPTSR